MWVGGSRGVPDAGNPGQLQRLGREDATAGGYSSAPWLNVATRRNHCGVQDPHDAFSSHCPGTQEPVTAQADGELPHAEAK